MSDIPILQPMIHVDDMAASVAFYEALGASLVDGSRDGDFAILQLGASQLSLLAHPMNPDDGQGAIELNFQTSDLASLHNTLAGSDVTVEQAPTDEAFGKQMKLRAPGGLLIKINELEPDSYR